ncbi:tripartite tricarboxylate transporter substrate binding protein [Comamonas sp.]|uniref:Bug family tripartite tricarboxylate transporter substrate binding protein n=1 Tax=Comamonas sp. TaxID=34028 RepID=UPI002898FDE6|nr:tripartite tricarboxylate transporter substrate binding protein [Comamonas sp.]
MKTIPTLILSAALAAMAGSALAQAWPAKPVRLVVSQPPGGTMDIVSRQIADQLGKVLGQPVVVDNRPGANGIIATQQVARAPADGYLLMMGTGATHTINPYIYPKVGYDPVKDFTPVANLVSAPNVIAVHSRVPATGLQALIDAAKTKPGALNYASPGVGGTGQLTMELLKASAGIDITHIPYPGIAASVQDTIAGRTEIVALPPTALLAHFQSGALRPLAVTSPQRTALLPDVPTVAESGFQGFEGVAWFGILGPAELPPEVVNTLQQGLRQVMNMPALRKRLASQGLDIIYSEGAAFASYMQKDADRWKEVIRLSGAKVE